MGPRPRGAAVASLLEMDCPKKEKEQCEKAGGKVTLKRDLVPKEAAVKKSEKLVKKKEDEKVPPTTRPSASVPMPTGTRSGPKSLIRPGRPPRGARSVSHRTCRVRGRASC